MHDNNHWQLFADNGTPTPGAGMDAANFDATSHNMGNTHIWFWKQNPDGHIAVLLQKRGPVKRRPGWFHASAAGHIDVGETVLQTAVRETKEEMGYTLDPGKLYFLFTTRVFGRAPHDISTVYLYKLTGTETFTHDDGEVAGFEWRSLDTFKKMTKNPEEHNLVPMGDIYFAALIAGLEHRTGANQ